MTGGPASTGPASQTPAAPQPGPAADSVAAMLAALSVADKVLLLTGADNWRTRGARAIGLRPMVVSDGPAGARGVTLDERIPSSSLPCPSALGATWDTELVTELAAALGAEARSKGIDVLLAPTINLMRTPLGGRGFECFSEDPVLTSRLAVAYVRGLQSAGVAATPKHYVGNDSETERWGYDARIGERVLRELYLAPFEACVREAGAAAVMAAYNKVNGIRMTEHAYLLREVLKGEWGFEGVAMSDWHATRSTMATALAALDLAMPGPDGPWGEQLTREVAAGALPREMLDDKVARLLRLARRVGALDGCRPATPSGADGPPCAAPRAAEAVTTLVDPKLLRRAAAASFVLLKNERATLPLRPGKLRRVAIIGPNAIRPATQGGGSATLAPAAASTPAAALAEALAGHAEVTVAPGCLTGQAVPAPAAGSLRDPVTGEPGLRLEFRGGDTALLAAEHRAATTFAWWDGAPPGVGWGESGSIVLLTLFRPEVSGPHLIGAAGVGRLVLTVDDEVLADEATSVPADPVEAMTRPGEVRAVVTLSAGTAARLRLEFWPAADGEGPLGLRLGIAVAEDTERLLARAVQAAREADAAVLVVGSAPLAESEGFDRPTLALPGRQDDLVEQVAAVNPATIVVVNSGMPMLMDWADRVPAVIYAWLPGQAIGPALADVLLGRAEPGGRLPVTLPVAERDCPVLHATPRDGVLSYDEGLLIGYRGYDASGVTPRFAFGHGLGYTTWDYESLTAAATALTPGDDLELRAVVRNTGPRPGREVVQAYLAGPPAPGGPARALAAFATVTAAPGAAVDAVLHVPARAFARWDEQAGGWSWPPGRFVVQAGRSSRDLRLTAAVTVG
jgi:beta-glucosidase